MADPISAIGLVAASAQLLEYSVKLLVAAIKSANDIHGLPSQLSALAGDLAYFEGLSLGLQQPSSLPLVDTAQEQRLADLLKASTELSGQLARELDALILGCTTAGGASGRTRAKAKKAWKTLVATTKEKEILKMVERLERLKEDLGREMVLAGLDAQIGLRRDVQAMETAISASIAGSEGELRNHVKETTELATDKVTGSIQQARDFVADSVEQSAQGTVESVSSEIRRNAGEVVSHVETNAALIMQTQSENHEALMAKVGLMASQKEDIREIGRQVACLAEVVVARNTLNAETSVEDLTRRIVSLIVSQQSENGASIAQAIRSAGPDGARRIETEVQRRLIDEPNTLVQAQQTQAMAFRYFKTKSKFPRPIPCSCRLSRSTRKFNLFGFVAKYSSEAGHSSDCPNRIFSEDESSWAVVRSLRPFVNKTVELCFKSTWGGGGFAIAPSLSVSRTVKRSESAAFQLFIDCFMQDIKELTGTSENAMNVVLTEELIRKVNALPTALMQVFSTGKAHPRDCDEQGNTLLDELLLLCQYVHHDLEECSDALAAAGNILLESGAEQSRNDGTPQSVQVFFESNRSSEPGSCYSFSVYLTQHLGDGALLALIYAKYAEISHLAISRQLKELVLDVGLHSPWIKSDALNGPHQGWSLVSRQHWVQRARTIDILRSLGQNELEELVAGGTISSLHRAVLSRSLEQVDKFKHLYSPAQERANQLPEEGHPYSLSVVECAVGWPAGIKHLLSLAYDGRPAIRLAVSTRDLPTVQAILDGEMPLPCGLSWLDSPLSDTLCMSCGYCRPADLIPVPGYDGREAALEAQHKENLMRRMFSLAIVQRRTELRSLAVKNLSPSVLDQVGTLKENILDLFAYETWLALNEVGTAVPEYLHPGIVPVFHTFNITCPERGLHLASELLEAGFNTIDAHFPVGFSTLQRAFYTVDKPGEYIEVWRWMIEHGSNPWPDMYRDYPSLLFSLAPLLWSSTSLLPRWDSDWDPAFTWLLDCIENGSWDRVSNAGEWIQQFSDAEKKAWEAKEPPVSMGEKQRRNDKYWVEYEKALQGFPRQYPSNDALLGKLIMDLAPKCGDPLAYDSCRCFCSGAGCLPIHKLGIFADLQIPKTKLARAKWWWEIRSTFRYWTELVGLDTGQLMIYMREMCRWECFQRLGMTHTCCQFLDMGVQDAWYVHKRVFRLPGDDTDEIQAEEAQLGRQLDLIVAAFREAMIGYAEHFYHPTPWDAWDWWWKMIAEILPELKPWERACQYYRRYTECSQAERPITAMAAAVLAKRQKEFFAGTRYEGMDFEDVIRWHLGDWLPDQIQFAAFDGEDDVSGALAEQDKDITTMVEGVPVSWTQDDEEEFGKTHRHYEKYDWNPIGVIR